MSGITSARVVSMAVLMLATGIAPLRAQRKPDFSGDWTLNRQASTLSPGADAVQSGVLRIEHREPAFHSTAEFVSPNGPLRYEYELQTDGREVAGTQGKIDSV